MEKVFIGMALLLYVIYFTIQNPAFAEPKTEREKIERCIKQCVPVYGQQECYRERCVIRYGK